MVRMSEFTVSGTTLNCVAYTSSVDPIMMTIAVDVSLNNQNHNQQPFSLCYDQWRMQDFVKGGYIFRPKKLMFFFVFSHRHFFDVNQTNQTLCYRLLMLILNVQGGLHLIFFSKYTVLYVNFRLEKAFSHSEGGYRP